jgi:hypothetical protein
MRLSEKRSTRIGRNAAITGYFRRFFRQKIYCNIFPKPEFISCKPDCKIRTTKLRGSIMIDKKKRLSVSGSSFSVISLILVISLALLFFACENGLSSIAGDSPASASVLSVTANTQDARFSERADRRAAIIEEAKKNGEWPNRARRLQLREKWQNDREERIRNGEWRRNNDERMRNRERPGRRTAPAAALP